MYSMGIVRRSIDVQYGGMMQLHSFPHLFPRQCFTLYVFSYVAANLTLKQEQEPVFGDQKSGRNQNMTTRTCARVEAANKRRGSRQIRRS